ncbi:MAG: hypothetical protein RI932_1707, partial [Pseudomonadota bacterium]
MTAHNTLSESTLPAHANTQLSTNPELAAVAYLNMLPFFFEKNHFCLF